MPRQPLSLKTCALGYLPRREYDHVKLRRKLVLHAEFAEGVDALLDWLEGENWLSNTRLVESVVHRYAGRCDIARLMQELEMYQLDEEMLGEIKAQLQDTEAVRVKAPWEKRFGRPPTDLVKQAKQVRYMMACGFSRSIMSRIITGANESLKDGDVSD